MSTRALPWFCLLSVLLALAGAARCLDQANQIPALQAADALPPYLAGAAVLDGQDPTTQAGLQAAYEAREMTVKAATFSNLYPATIGFMMQPLSRLPWTDFIPIWRVLLVACALLVGAASGWASVRGKWAPVAAGGGACATVWIFPYTGECAGLGQVNLSIAALLGLCMLALSTRREGLAGAAAALGACIKLVPAIVLVTLAAARSTRGLLFLAGIGLAILGLTLGALPLSQVIHGIQGTIQFQSSISPDWMNLGPTPTWMRFLGDIRHTPLALATVTLMGICCWNVPETRRAPVLAGSVALASAWLGADAAAFHVLYAPLFLPAMVWLGTGFLDEEAPSWTRWLALLALTPWVLSWSESETLGAEARQVIAGLLLWGGVAARLIAQTRSLRGPEVGALGIVAGLGVALAVQLSVGPRGPSPESLSGDSLLPEGVGHGGPVPGEADDRGPADRLAEEVLASAQAQRITSHLIQAPAGWKTQDTASAQHLLDQIPAAPAGQQSYGTLLQWLAWERTEAMKLDPESPPRVRVERLWTVLSED